MQELTRILKPNRRSAVTLAGVTRFLIEECQAGRLEVSIFKECIEYARSAAGSRTAHNPIGLLMAKVKEKTGFRKQGKLLSG